MNLNQTECEAKRITFVHFFMLGLLLLNLLIRSITDFGLDNSLLIVLKGILYLSGIFLFFVSVRYLRKVTLYYSFFILTPIVLGLFYFVHGIFLGLIVSIFVAPIMPIEADYEINDLNVYTRFNGFLGNCCNYYVTKNHFYLIEEFKGEFQGEGLNFNESTIELRGDSIFVIPRSNLLK